MCFAQRRSGVHPTPRWAASARPSRPRIVGVGRPTDRRAAAHRADDSRPLAGTLRLQCKESHAATFRARQRVSGGRRLTRSQFVHVEVSLVECKAAASCRMECGFRLRGNPFGGRHHAATLHALRQANDSVLCHDLWSRGDFAILIGILQVEEIFFSILHGQVKNHYDCRRRSTSRF